MNVTTSEIRDIIKIAREDLLMSTDDIINATITKSLTAATGFRPKPAEILEIVCKFHEIKLDWVKSKSLLRQFTRVRQQYCLIAILFKYSTKVTGMEINRDHSTAVFSRNKALGFYKVESEYELQVDDLINEFPRHKTILMERLLNLIVKP